MTVDIIRIPIRKWTERFNEGMYSSKDVLTQVDAGWYDWFCRDESLSNKTNTMGQVIKQLKDGGKIDLDKSFIWFKNNCPLSHPLYDDFKVANIDDGATTYIVQFNSPWANKKYSVLNVDDFFDEIVFETESRRELVKWLNNELEV